MQKFTWLKEYLNGIYDTNPYVKLLDMHIESMEEGEAVLLMPVTSGKHTNLYGVAHGGAVASLADTAMGVACATCGNRVVTIDMNINFIKSALSEAEVRAAAKVIHCGRQTMVVECEIKAIDGSLLAKARGTFCVIGHFDVA